MPRIHVNRGLCMCCSTLAKWCRTLFCCTWGVSVHCRKTRGLLRRRVVQLFLFVLSLLLTAFLLHTLVLPKAMGYYHEDCHLLQERRERMRFLLRHVVSFLNEENATYWLDFGTFLGVIREGDIIAHDGDMDISRLADDLDADRRLVSRFVSTMRAVGIRATDLTARYKDVQVDMFRWQTHNSSSGRPMLSVYYPFVPAWSLAEKIIDYLMPKDIPTDVLFPLRKIEVFGVMASIPCRTLDYLKLRYPLTWYMNFPYKWKCWVRWK